jgi:hypothetical protein
MSALTKIPPFILSYSRDQENEYVIHTKDPAFIAKVLYPESEEEASDIKSKIDYWVEIDFKGRKTILAVIELFQPVSSEDRMKGVLKRLEHWYKSLMIERFNQNKL